MDLPSDLFQNITGALTVTGQQTARPSDRRAPRVQFNSHLTAVRWSDPSSPFSVRLRDLSAGGLGLLHASRFSLDEQLVVRLPVVGGQTVLVLGTVVYWEPLAEALFAAGMQFEQVVQEAELEQQAQAEPRMGENVFRRMIRRLAS